MTVEELREAVARLPRSGLALLVPVGSTQGYPVSVQGRVGSSGLLLYAMVDPETMSPTEPMFGVEAEKILSLGLYTPAD